MKPILKKSILFSLISDFIGRHPFLFFTLVFTLLINGALSILVAGSIAPLADYLIDPNLARVNSVTLYFINIIKYFGIKPGILVFSIIFAIGNLFSSALTIVIFYINRKTGYAIFRDLNQNGLNKFFNARWSLFSQLNQGTILNTFNTEIPKVVEAMTGFANLVANFFQLVMALALPIFIMPVMVGVSAISLVLLTLPFLLLQPISKRLGQLNTITGNRLMEVLTESFQAVKLIMGYGMQNHSIARYLKTYDDHVKITLKTQVMNSGVSNLHFTIGIIAVLSGMVVAIQFGGLLSDVAIALWSLQRGLLLFTSMFANKINLDGFAGSYEQLQILFKKAEAEEEITGNLIFQSLKKEIRFENVNFTYPERSPLFQKLNINIPKGKMTAFIGESGSGKSTVVDLVLGLQVPNSGKILIDEINFDDYNRNSFREKIGYVPQDPILFHASLRENLLWSFEEATEKDLWDVCRIANAEAFIRNLPDGLDTIVGDRGLRLSGGQRQRIALARALIRKPELLILDEATSSLDTESEKLIQESIEKVAKNTTILVIAHRLSTVMNADKIYVMKAGQVIEEGNFLELSSNPESSLSSMLQTQSGNIRINS